MATSNWNPLLQQIRRLSGSPNEPASDGQLLERFLAARDEAAFTALVRRHGPMVFGLCRRVLHNEQDAEDAFQAAFLVLARKAASVRQHRSLGGWLHEVAYHLALRAKENAMRQRKHEREVRPMTPSEEPTVEVSRRELRSLLDEELRQLPAKYREPLILCYLEGKTNEQAARQLGWPAGSMARRLARGRELLRRRLLRRGVSLSAVGLATALVEEAVPAAVPPLLAASVVRMVLQTSATGVPASVAALVEGRIREMFLVKLRLALFVTLTVVSAGAGALAFQTKGKQPAEEQPAPTAKAAEKQPRTDLYGDPLPPGALVRLGTVRLRQSFATMAFSTEGKTLLSAGVDQTVRCWDMPTGKEVRRTLLQSSKELDLPLRVLSADGKSVVGFADAGACVWDASTGKVRHRIPIEEFEFSTALALSPDGKTVAHESVEVDSFIRLWDVATGKELRRLARENPAPVWAFSSDGKLLGATDSNVLHLWEVATGKEIRKMRVGGTCLTISPHGKWVVLGDFKGNLKRWDVASGEERPAPRRMSAGITSLASSPDGKLLAVGSADEELILWDVAARKQLWKVSAQCSGRSGLLFAPDGKTVASSSAAAIHLWDVATGKEIGTRPAHDSNVDSLAVAPDGKVLATTTQFDQAIRIWDPSSGKLLTRLPGHGRGSNTCAFSADGKLVVSGGNDGTVRVWDRASGKEVRSFPVEALPPRTIALRIDRVYLSQQGDRLAAMSSATISNGGPTFTESQLDVWEMSTGKRLAHRPCPFGLRDFAPNGRRIAVVSKSGAVIEDAVTGRALVRISGNLGAPVAISPNGQLLAAAVYKPDERTPAFLRDPKDIIAIRLTEVATGKPLVSLKTGRADFPLLAFSPRGRILATNDAEAIHLWDVATGEELPRRSPPERLKSLPAPSPLAFLPGGRLATGLADTTVLIWDVASAVRRAGMSAKDLDDAALQRLWADLAGEDAAKAHQAVGTLAAVPAKATPFLKDHLHPAAAVDAKQVQRLIADLDSPEFAVREEARQKLASFGEQAEPMLRQALEGKPSLEARKRLEALHADAELASRGIVRSADLLRTLRAIRVLEHIGDQDARQVLQKLAAGDPAARATRQAKEALQRLERRDARQGSR